jgi:aspartate kinase
VEPHKVRGALKHGEIAIVAGFQGRTRKKKVVTTLGRGGSDLTAVALAASLGASVCEIYTDVDGVYTADPRVVPTARKIDVISSEEMLELAASGAKILHLRCVEYARRFGLPIHVRSSFVAKTGTLILPALDQGHGFEPPMEQPVVSSVSGADSAAKITVAGVSSMPGATAEIFEALAASGLHIDMIAQNSRPSAVDIVFTLPTVQAPDALEVLNAVRTGIGFEVLEHEDHVGKVTVSGLGMRSSPEVLSIFLKTLSDARVDTGLISTSETCITAVMRADQLEEAVSALREAFHLSRQRREVPTLS